MHATTVDQLYRQHHHALVAAVRRQVHHISADSAEDAAQHVWELLMRLPDGRINLSDPRPIRNYLIVCARRYAIHAENRRHNAEAISLDHYAGHDDSLGGPLRDLMPAPGSDRDADARLELRELLDTLDELTPGQATSQLCQLLGLSYQEEAAATGRTYTTVNRNRTEGRAALRNQLRAS